MIIVSQMVAIGNWVGERSPSKTSFNRSNLLNDDAGEMIGQGRIQVKNVKNAWTI